MKPLTYCRLPPSSTVLCIQSTGEKSSFQGLGLSCIQPLLTQVMQSSFLPILQNQERSFVLKVSALEIYNEVVKDLLTSETNPLRLLDDKDVNYLLPWPSFQHIS